MIDPRGIATRSLQAHSAGDSGAAERLLPLVYDRLRDLARRYLVRERPDHSYQPTELVHEAYLRLIDIDRIDWQGKTHFYAMAATQMRRILVEHARAAATRRRGGKMARVTLNDADAIVAEDPVALLALDEALDGLARRGSRQARVAELRLFAGLAVKEIAFVVGVSERTVKGDWRVARAWLLRELDRKAGKA